MFLKRLEAKRSCHFVVQEIAFPSASTLHIHTTRNVVDIVEKVRLETSATYLNSTMRACRRGMGSFIERIKADGAGRLFFSNAGHLWVGWLVGEGKKRRLKDLCLVVGVWRAFKFSRGASAQHVQFSTHNAQLPG